MKLISMMSPITLKEYETRVKHYKWSTYIQYLSTKIQQSAPKCLGPLPCHLKDKPSA